MWRTYYQQTPKRQAATSTPSRRAAKKAYKIANGPRRHAPALAARDGDRCFYGGSGPLLATGVFEVDHYTPKSRGGTDEPENLRLSCRPCNLQKARMPGDEYIQWRVEYGVVDCGPQDTLPALP